jgi:hypothetical protein
MLLLSPPRLPDFDQAATDRRFLTELDRLLQVGVLDSYADFARTLGIRKGVIGEIETGRYHCNLKLLYGLVQHYPQADLNFIVFGALAAAGARPEPQMVPARQRGRRPAQPRRGAGTARAL